MDKVGVKKAQSRGQQFDPAYAVCAICVARLLSTFARSDLGDGGLTVAGSGLLACLSVSPLVLIAVASKYRPSLMRPRAFSFFAAALIAAGCLVTYVAREAGRGDVALIGSAIETIGCAWVDVIWLLACSRLPVTRLVPCLAIGCAAATVAERPLLGLLEPSSVAIVCAGLDIAVVLGSCRLARGFISRYHELGVPATREIATPGAILPFMHRLFTYILAFSVVFGIVLGTGLVEATTAPDVATLCAMAALTAYAFLRKDDLRIDPVFVVAQLSALFGFVSMAALHGRGDGLATSLITAGYMCFEIVVWSTLCAVATRSPVDAVPAISWGSAANLVGVFVGGALSPIVAQGLPSGDAATGHLVAALAVVMAGYTLVTWRSFGFDATIAGIEPDAPLSGTFATTSIEHACAEIAARHELTPRESQVLVMLARGYDAIKMQEELGVSRNTVKFHVKNVYAKVGAHRQQEVIDMCCGETTSGTAL